MTRFSKGQTVILGGVSRVTYVRSLPNGQAIIEYGAAGSAVVSESALSLELEEVDE